MDLVTESFEVSIDVENRLNEYSEIKGINIAELTVQCIDIAYKITTTLRAERQFYCGSVPLALPEAHQLPNPTFNHLEMSIFLVDLMSFAEIASKLGIDKQSVLSWAMDCLPKSPRSWVSTNNPSCPGPWIV